MRILFAISILALAALLWASVATARHVRRVRREHRRRRSVQAERSLNNSPNKSPDTGRPPPPWLTLESTPATAFLSTDSDSATLSVEGKNLFYSKEALGDLSDPTPGGPSRPRLHNASQSL